MESKAVFFSWLTCDMKTRTSGILTLDELMEAYATNEAAKFPPAVEPKKIRAFWKCRFNPEN